MSATVSVASSIALVETNKGCKTFSSRMFEIKPCSKVVQSVDAKTTRHEGTDPRIPISSHLPNVDSSVLLAQSVPVSQLGDDSDRVQTGVLGERSRDDFERFSKRLKTIGLFASQRLAVLGEQARNVDLGSPTSGDQCPAYMEKRPGVSTSRICKSDRTVLTSS